MRLFARPALAQDDGARGGQGGHGRRHHHPKTKIIGVNHGAFGDGLVIIRGAATTAAAAATATVVTTARVAAHGRTRRVVAAAAVSVALLALTGVRDSLSVATMVSEGALGAAAVIVARTRADCVCV
jgi:hypothetical protein